MDGFDRQKWRDLAILLLRVDAAVLGIYLIARYIFAVVV